MRGDAPTGHGESHSEDHASMAHAPANDGRSLVRVHASEELREPTAETGYRYYVGQHIRMPRKTGGAPRLAACGGVR